MFPEEPLEGPARRCPLPRSCRTQGMETALMSRVSSTIPDTSTNTWDSKGVTRAHVQTRHSIGRPIAPRGEGGVTGTRRSSWRRAPRQP